MESKTTIALVAALTAIVISGVALGLSLMTAPGKQGTPGPTGPAGAQGPPGPPGIPAIGVLTLSLEPSLDGGGDIKATTITSAELLSFTSAVIKTATITGGGAQFNLSGLAIGDYFIRVNGLSDDLIPTRIDDPTRAISQFVGQKLRMNVIGNLSDLTYRIKTFSMGQSEHTVVKYSNGTTAPPERYAYALVSLKTRLQIIEIRVLGTGMLLTSFTPGTGPHTFATWILGGENHGKPANYPNDAACSSCHGNLDTQLATYASITPSSGWCFSCHYGKGGDPNGMVDPTQ